MRKGLVSALLFATIFNFSEAGFLDPRYQKTGHEQVGYQKTGHRISARLQAIEVLHEAIDHSDVLPEKTLSLLDKHEQYLEHLNENQQAQWFSTVMIASIKTSNLQSLEESIFALEEFKQNQYVEENKQTIINGIGVWYLRKGLLNQAKQAYQCNLTSSINEKSQIRSLLNLAVVERNLGNIDSAYRLNKRALMMSNKLELEHSIAIINNNLGILALTKKNYHKAQVYFTNAMNMNDRLMRRSGEILAGINLLHLFVRQNAPLMFERLFSRVKLMLEPFPKDTRHAYLDIIQTVHLYQVGNISYDQANSLISEQHKNIEDVGIKRFLEPLLEQFDLTIPRREIVSVKPISHKHNRILSSCSAMTSSLNS